MDSINQKLIELNNLNTEIQRLLVDFKGTGFESIIILDKMYKLIEKTCSVETEIYSYLVKK